MIEVRLFATLRTGREKVTFFSADEVTDGFSILKRLDIDDEEVAIFLINGKHSALSSVPIDGDIVAVFPAVGGG
jgi:molybdopterin converting factor small subunit